MRQIYYKIRQLLQNATFIGKCDSTLIHLRTHSPMLWMKLRTPKLILKPKNTARMVILETKNLLYWGLVHRID